MSRIPLDPRGGECACTRPLLPLAFLLLILAASSLYAQWQHLPAGTAVLTGLADDASGQVIYAGADIGGLWRSPDGGATWEPISSISAPEGGSWIQELTQVGSTSDTMICTGMRNYEVWAARTYDGGQTWIEFNDPIRWAQNFVVSRSNHNLWLCAAWSNIQRSANAGSNWWQIQIGDQVDFIRDDRFHDSTFYAFSYERVWRSVDGGMEWQIWLSLDELEFSIERNYDILRLSNDDLLISVMSYTTGFGRVPKLFRSTDDGETWNLEDGFPGLLTIDYRISFTLIESASVPGRIFCTHPYVPGGLLRSDDYGQTWQPAAHGLPDAWQDVSTVFQNEFTGTLYVSTGIGLYRSNDNGDTWNPITPLPAGMSDIFYPRLIFDEEAVFYFQEGTARLFQMENPWTEWQYISKPNQYHADTLFDFDFPVMTKLDSQLYSMAVVVMPDWNYASCTARSEDNGLTWTLGQTLGPFISPYDISVLNNDSTHRWMALQSSSELTGIIWLSEDLGETWSQIAAFPTNIHSIHQTSTVTYVMTEVPWQADRVHVHRSTNLGETWEQLDTLAIGWHFTFLGDTVVARYDSMCMIWNGTEWEERGPLPNAPGYYPILTAVPINPPLVIAKYAESADLLISTDLGLTWHTHPYEIAYEQQLWGASFLHYDPFRERLWMTTSLGTYYLPVTELSADDPLTFKPADYTLLSVYPNPFNSETRIRYDLLKREHVEIALYNLQGRFVKSLADEIQAAGRHELNLSLSDFASGVYFVQLKTSNTYNVEKVLLLK